jgi:acetyl-CoA synthetase
VSAFSYEGGTGSLPKDAKIIPAQGYRSTWEISVKDPEQFWDSVARELYWFKTWDKVLEWKYPFARWFVGGLLNASYNAVDRHVKTWRKNKAAILWEGENGERRVLTYQGLYNEVNRFANVLKNLGVQKGDRIAFYMPMVPEFPAAVLAAARIGAIFTVVFSGFSASALSGRLNDCKAKVVVTADGGYRRGKTIQLKEIVDEALADAPSVESVVVYKRIGRDITMKEGRDFWWHDLIAGAKPYAAPEPLESNHPLYILYTSGTTGKPKGAVHGTGGYLTYVHATTKWVFDTREDDVYWCTADIGWVTGHSYVIFGPLSHGLTMVMYEGAPDYPAPDRWWEIIERYGVTVFYTTPTAIRALMKFGDDLPRKHNFSSLRILGTVGEPINPAAWQWYYDVIGQGRCPIVDTWWQTETGGILISPTPNLGIMPLKPGSATLPLPGIEPDIVDEKGDPLPAGQKGFLVIKKPWPGMLMTLYNDDERYKQVYWSRFLGFYYPGDYALKDHDGYFWLLGRADEVLKVAGHRLGTIEIEDAFVSHPAVAEAAVAGKPDTVKGEAIVAFVTLKKSFSPSKQLRDELREHVRKTIGPIATPDEIHFVNLLPKTRSGKIMRRVVKAVASGAEIGDITTLEDGASIEEVKSAIDEFMETLKAK